MRTLPIALAVLLIVSCGADQGIDDCNFEPAEVAVENRSQFTIESLELNDGENLLEQPLAPNEGVVVTGFEYASNVSFVRPRADAQGDIRVTTEERICVTPDNTLVLFDQSFRVE